MTDLSFSRRLRRTPFSQGVEAAGVKGYTVYNRMLLPTVFESPEADYWHLKSAVQVWDVSCERQIEIAGPDADALMQLLTPRDLSKLADDQCFYIPVVNGEGGMLNDPVTLKPDANRWWISIADSDLLLWVKGIVAGRGLDVTVTEPPVFPLAVQGPKADDVIANMFGDWIRDIKYFEVREVDYDIPIMLARSGFSKQGGFEIYLMDFYRGTELWERVVLDLMT